MRKEYWVAKIGVDTAENEVSQVWNFWQKNRSQKRYRIGTAIYVAPKVDKLRAEMENQFAAAAKRTAGIETKVEELQKALGASKAAMEEAAREVPISTIPFGSTFSNLSTQICIRISSFSRTTFEFEFSQICVRDL